MLRNWEGVQCEQDSKFYEARGLAGVLGLDLSLKKASYLATVE